MKIAPRYVSMWGKASNKMILTLLSTFMQETKKKIYAHV